MRYLYGDSTPFPLGYNFLTTLEAFMTASTRIVQLDVEGVLLAKQRDEVAQNRVKGLEALEQFHNVVMRAVQDTAQKVQHQHALEYARAVAEYATHYIEEHRRTTLGSNERESMQLRGDGDRRASEMRAQLEAFLKAARFPVLKTKLSLRLNLDGREARHSGTAAFDHPDGISTSFTIAPHRTAAWTAPRKVSDFVQGIDLKVGVEKSWLRGTVTAKQLSVDDWTIMQLDMSDESFELVLRRKLQEKEMLVFHIRRNEAGGIGGTVEHPGAPGAEALPGNLGGQDVAQIERIWIALKAAMREVVDQKEQLLNVSLDAQPVFENGLAVPFVVRLVSMFGPTVREIAKRSPNEFELTLKTEAEGGRREELYLRKEALVSTLQPLPAKGREVFAPLGLDSWVPSMTAAPPAVAMSEASVPRLNLASDVPAAIPSAPPGAHPAVPPVPPPVPPPAPTSTRKLS
jgi:hypothetical protein